ncbi:MAG: 3-deoxy-D-manno-octulosonic acid transferase, partial [Hyphomonadaceae bacterium]
DALLVIAPRHTERGGAIAALAAGAPRRALREEIGQAPVYIADTMGELGLFYAAAPVSLVAGSLLPAYAGHNPAEPAKLGSAILSGPHVASFADLYAAFEAASAMRFVRDADAIAANVARLWADSAAREAMAAHARGVAEAGGGALEETIAALAAILRAARPQQSRTLHAPA